MIVSIIAAMDQNRLIGNNNQLPWHMPADFAHFKAVTMGKPIVMGRKTFDSIGKPLPGRTNIVLSRNPDTRFEGVVCVSNFDDAMAVVPDAEEIMVIGGSAIYEMLLPVVAAVPHGCGVYGPKDGQGRAVHEPKDGQVNRMYLTYVDAVFEGDAWFPVIDEDLWLEKESVTYRADGKNVYSCRFVILEKRIK